VKLREQLSLGFGLFAATLLVAVLLPLGLLLSHEHLSSLRTELLRMGRSAAKTWQSDGVDAARSRFAPAGKIAVWTLNGQGVPLGSPTDVDAFPPPRTGGELFSAWNGGVESTARRFGGRQRLYAALPVVSHGDVEGVLWLSVPMRPVQQLNARTWLLLGIVGAIVLVLAVVSGYALARRLSHRLGDLADATHRFGEDLSFRLPMQGRDEVGELAAALNDMATRIQATLDGQTQFVAAASHQLRTPLTAIRLRVDELRSIGLDDPLSGEYLDEMADQVVRLEGLTVQLLRLLSADATVAHDPVSVDAAVDEAVQSVAPLARRRGVHIDVNNDHAGLVAQAPAGALEQVLMNLVDNAVKYSSARVLVDVTPSNGCVGIAVRDDGPGIDGDASVHAFNAFYRGTSNGPGFGLGLAIAKRICEASGAEISLERAPEGGTLARVSWPTSA
jgi:signal transduction histidine kinase